jgi:hypothetical protein
VGGEHKYLGRLDPAYLFQGNNVVEQASAATAILLGERQSCQALLHALVEYPAIECARVISGADSGGKLTFGERTNPAAKFYLVRVKVEVHSVLIFLKGAIVG